MRTRAGLARSCRASPAHWVRHSRGALRKPHREPAATQSATAPPSCHQLYKTWQYGPPRALSGQIVPALRKVEAAGKLEDIPELNSALKHAGHIAQRLVAYPMPACADPKGYWTRTLGYLKAAGDNASTSSGLAGLLMAMAPLEQVNAVENNLGTELQKTTGS
jgi:hypothetical protein